MFICAKKIDLSQKKWREQQKKGAGGDAEKENQMCERSEQAGAMDSNSLA